jgi:hypothetical protein
MFYICIRNSLPPSNSVFSPRPGTLNSSSPPTCSSASQAKWFVSRPSPPSPPPTPGPLFKFYSHPPPPPQQDTLATPPGINPRKLNELFKNRGAGAGKIIRNAIPPSLKMFCWSLLSRFQGRPNILSFFSSLVWQVTSLVLKISKG